MANSVAWPETTELLNSFDCNGYSCINPNKLSHAPAISEFDNARDLGKQSIIFACAHVFTSLHLGPALADNNGTARNELPGEYLNAEPLGVRIAPVFRTA